MKTSYLNRVGMTVATLVLVIAVISILPVSAAEVTVTRDLPDEPVYPEDEIDVSLTQSGFYNLGGGGIGSVRETLPEGFAFRGLVSGNATYEYDEPTRDLKIEFRNEVTVTYRLKAGTAKQIEDAVFSGTWKTLDTNLDTLSGDVGGDDTLELGEKYFFPIETYYDAAVYGGNGDGTMDLQELTNAIQDYLDEGYPFGDGGLFDKQDLIDYILAYINQ